MLCNETLFRCSELKSHGNCFSDIPSLVLVSKGVIRFIYDFAGCYSFGYGYNEGELQWEL